MLNEQGNPTAGSTATITEEDWLRRYNSGWRDTAVGRRNHYETCPRTSHRNCGDTA